MTFLPRSLSDYVREVEKRAIKDTLVFTKGRKAEAAAVLGLSRKNLWEKMHAYGLNDWKVQDELESEKYKPRLVLSKVNEGDLLLVQYYGTLSWDAEHIYNDVRAAGFYRSHNDESLVISDSQVLGKGAFAPSLDFQHSRMRTMPMSNIKTMEIIDSQLVRLTRRIE
ncbi:MAG: helix-turn-helix domain-containing protein [Nanoarchaeota archaeon]